MFATGIIGYLVAGAIRKARDVRSKRAFWRATRSP